MLSHITNMILDTREDFGHKMDMGRFVKRVSQALMPWTPYRCVPKSLSTGQHVRPLHQPYHLYSFIWGTAGTAL